MWRTFTTVFSHTISLFTAGLGARSEAAQAGQPAIASLGFNSLTSSRKASPSLPCLLHAYEPINAPVDGV